MKNVYLKWAIIGIFLLCFQVNGYSTGEPSNYFNIFVPPNNDAVQRNVCLVITAIFDSTSFTITDDGMDGDTDDSKSGILMAGQSYILYIKDNGINDDARYASGGVLKQDGDYFIIQSNKNVYASQSTNSDWQHDWVPGTSQSSLSQKFIIYAPKVTSSKRDLNVFAYEDSTFVTLRRISKSSTTQSGYTDVDYQGGTIIFQRMINRGQDLIYFYADARNIMDDGHTYIIETSKPATVQYGALIGNERDGGGYVPTNTGSSSGSLAYFAVPYQAAGEQEIRIVSWDAGNNVKLYRYSAGNWILMNNWNMGQRTFQDWVGKNNGNAAFPTVFKIECTPGKRVSIFEGNWFETGSPGTSDMATMMSAENGTSSGDYYIAYMAPPGSETNVLNPFTGKVFGGQFTHLYIFSQDTAHVVVKDAYTNGADITRNYTILPNRYVDCALSLEDWRKIYNGTGTNVGPERPYLTVSSDNPVSVMNTNFNDNWMMYFGSSQFRRFTQSSSSSSSVGVPGQALTITSDVNVVGSLPITNVSAEVMVEGGLTIQSSTFNDLTNNKKYQGTSSQNGGILISEFTKLPNLAPGGDYNVVLVLEATVMDGAGNAVPNNSVSDVTIVVNGTSNGRQLQSTSIESVALNSLNTSNLIFDYPQNTGIENMLTDSWTVSTIDYDNDGDDDLFFTDKNANQPNRLFRNNGNRTFTSVSGGNLTSDVASSIASAWADFDNDGDIDVVVANNTLKACFFYTNNGNGTFTKNSDAGFTKNVGYYHHVSWVDVDNDGKLELYLGNYWPTRLNELWKRDETGIWVLSQDNLLSQVAGSGTGSTWADYDNDGYQDLLILDNEGGKNRMYRNQGNGTFEVVTNAITNKGGHSVASTWGDIDNDGDLDLFVSNASNYNNDLFINNGNGAFTAVTNQEVVKDRGHSHGCAFADVDKDGDLDLYVANDQGVKFLYLNDGTGGFTKKTDEWPAANLGKTYGASFSDLDLDGDLDLVTATHSNQRNFIFTANNTAKKWITMRLIGTKSNKSAVGARIRIKANGKNQIREVSSQNGLGGQGSFRQHFGCENTSVIDTVEIRWPSGYVQHISQVNTNQHMVITEENSAEVTALAYTDLNNNCSYDEGETLLQNVKFKVNNGQLSAFSDKKGKVTMHLKSGNYNINMADQNMAATCTTPTNFTVANVGSSVNLGSFALQSFCSSSDLEVKAITPMFRSGFRTKYIIEVSNKGVGTGNDVVLSSTLITGLSIDSASVNWNSMVTNGNSQTISWNLGSMNYGDIKFITLYFRVMPFLEPGNDVVSQFEVVSSNADCDNQNNAISDLQSIFGSVDPNDLLAFPHGYPNKSISPKQEITYRIRFQNVGNYKADFVNLIDTLPKTLDISQMSSISASHNYQITLLDNIMMVHFPDIQLPDSTTDLEGSNGYIQFTLPQVKGNTAGTIIENRAAIQFDYSKFIITNTIQHYVKMEELDNSLGELILIPNPSNGSFSFKAKGENMVEFQSLEIHSQVGAVIYSQAANGYLPNIENAQLNSGYYYVIAKDLYGKRYLGRLVVIK